MCLQTAAERAKLLAVCRTIYMDGVVMSPLRSGSRCTRLEGFFLSRTLLFRAGGHPLTVLGTGTRMRILLQSDPGTACRQQRAKTDNSRYPDDTPSSFWICAKDSALGSLLGPVLGADRLGGRHPGDRDSGAAAGLEGIRVAMLP